MTIHPAYGKKVGNAFNLHYNSQAAAFDVASRAGLLALPAFEPELEVTQRLINGQAAALAETYHIALG